MKHHADVLIAPLTKILTTDSESLPQSPADTIEREARHQQARKSLQISPYSDPPHLLDLSSISFSHQLLAEALTAMDKSRVDYRTALYQEAFNWHDVMSRLRSLLKVHNGFQWHQQSFFAVVFKSEIDPKTDYSHLSELDRHAHAEATASGGLLKYWFGRPDSEGRNLATCVWRDRSDAVTANVKPAHRRAAIAASKLYKTCRIERFRLIVGDDANEWKLIELEVQKHEFKS